MATIKAGSGAIKVTSSGKLATTCGAIVCEDFETYPFVQSAGDGELKHLTFQKNGVQLPYYEFDGFPKYLLINGFRTTTDDIVVISPEPPSGGSFSISASGGFVIAPSGGLANGGCCVDPPNSMSVSIGGNTYTSHSNCGTDDDEDPYYYGIRPKALADGLEAAGLFVARKFVWIDDNNPKFYGCSDTEYETDNVVFSADQLRGMGFTGTKLRMYGAILGCGYGEAKIAMSGCRYVKWQAIWDCTKLEWLCIRPIGVASGDPAYDTPVGEWVTNDGSWFTCIVDSASKPSYPTPYTCRGRFRASYKCFSEDAEKWIEGQTPLVTGFAEGLPLYGWSRYELNDTSNGYIAGGDFECCVEAQKQADDSWLWVTPEDPPSTPPNCYCEWSAYYDCYSQSWQIDQGECYATHETASNVNQWVGTGGYRTMVSTSNTEPSPPGDTPTCVTYWEAYWNGTSWDKYGFYTDIGEESAWACYGAEYASGAFAVGVTPDDPDCEE